MPIRFPESFVFGASTAAYQIEGAAQTDGRGEGIWDRYSHTPGKIHQGDTGDIACDHYHRFEEDLDLAQAASMTAYRFSINWARVLPDGVGRVNEAGLAFYDRLVDACIARGLEPWVCFYHWDYSQVLQDQGGWANRASVDWFLELVQLVTNRLKDRVTHWCLFNEPTIFTSLGYLLGQHAPGLKDPAAYGAAVHHVSLATADGVRLVRRLAPGAKVGTVLSINGVQPASTSPEDVAASALADAVMNRAFLDPIFKGTYPDEIGAMVTPFIRDGDMDRLKADLDFLGINHYTRSKIAAKPASVSADGATAGGGMGFVPPPAGTPITLMGWEIRPEGIYEVIARVYEQYAALPIYITENGGAFPDEVTATGEVLDHDRIGLLTGYLSQIARAINDGYDVRGYLVWSLLDNFEWGHGYSKRFGLVHIDYESQKRTPKASYQWYRQLAQCRTIAD
ncbi:GH1 family beta-glucosidase [Aquidulcibacter sp.]|uniref:GH1 family beta-glucosidase n=1 Tax=Aquidulcibacter sp. TaxID=2052990 RepID=UPI0025BFF974|nr:GH1 family beta-glucosidase [Aquidulcibacter sp.]MCA3697428.1 beta-glucosidase [Aquidulcibacter sp.]